MSAEKGFPPPVSLFFWNNGDWVNVVCIVVLCNSVSAQPLLRRTHMEYTHLAMRQRTSIFSKNYNADILISMYF